MKTPALPPAPLSTSNPPPMVLWFRPHKGAWRQVAFGTGQACTNAIGVVERNGTWQTLPVGKKPKPDFRG